MKNYYVIIDTKNSKEATQYLQDDGITLSEHLYLAKTLKSEEEAEDYIKENKIEYWARVEEEE